MTAFDRSRRVRRERLAGVSLNADHAGVGDCRAVVRMFKEKRIRRFLLQIAEVLVPRRPPRSASTRPRSMRTRCQNGETMPTVHKAPSKSSRSSGK
jgi:hypothetical protein